MMQYNGHVVSKINLIYDSTKLNVTTFTTVIVFSRASKAEVQLLGNHIFLGTTSFKDKTVYFKPDFNHCGWRERNEGVLLMSI
jgi:hypothetical protein